MMLLYLSCVLIFAKGIHSGGLREDTIPGDPTMEVVPSSTSVLIRWTPPSDYQSTVVRGYKLSYGTRVPDENSIDTSASTFSLRISDLEPSTAYIFKLLAYNDFGNGLPTYQFVETLPAEDASTPDPIGGSLTPPILSAEAQSSDSVLLTWTGIEGATDGRYYTVRYKTKPPSRWTSKEVTETSYLVTGLEPDTLYEFEVKVVSGSESSLYSLSVFSRTEEGVPTNNTGEPVVNECQPITVPFCSPPLVPYNHTILPNFFGQTNQSEITYEMQEWLPIAVTGCSFLIAPFLCSMYVPVCTELQLPIPPCKEVCDKVQNDCQAAIDAISDFTWPDDLRCEDFPRTGTKGDICIGEELLSGPPPSPVPGGPNGPGGDPFGPGGPPEHCELIETVSLCDPTVYPEIPFNYTMFPNILGQESQFEVDYYSFMFKNLIESECSPLLRFFVCTALLPVCSIIPVPLPPCKETCELPRDQCTEEMESQGFTWPEELDCENFPSVTTETCIGFSPEEPTEPETSGDGSGDGEGEEIMEPPPITEGTATCETLSDAAKELCPGIEYTETIFPNTLGHRNQEEAVEMLTMQTSVMGMECPIGQFLCVLAFPPCKRFGVFKENAVPLLPCREECAYVKTACIDVNFNEVIPSVDRLSTELDCNNFPEYYSEPPLCWELTNGFSRDKPNKTEDSLCSDDIPDMCRDLGFKATSYPNVFDHADSTSAMEIIEELQPLIDSGCSPELASFVCAAHFPVCNVNGTVSLPCHESCRRVWKPCKATAELLGIERPKVFGCSKNYPAAKDGDECLWAFTAPELSPTVKSIDREPNSAKLVLLPEDSDAKFFNVKIFGEDVSEEKQIPAVSDKPTTVVIEDLSPGNTYYATINTENDFGESSTIVETIPKHEGIECHPLEIEMCQDLGYDMALADGHPNRLGHIDQAEALSHLEQFGPLIQIGCSPDILRFLCWVFAPGCSPDVNEVMPPCRESCESARFGCENLIQAFGFQWPDILECDQFPYKNDTTSLCEGGSQLRYWGTQGSGSPGSEYHCMKIFETGPQPKWYDPQDNEISEDPEQDIYSTVLNDRITRLVIEENSRDVIGKYSCRLGDFKKDVEIYVQGTCYNNLHPVCSRYFDAFFLPNTLNHTEETDAVLSVNAFLPLIATDCSDYLNMYACYLYMPRNGCYQEPNVTKDLPDVEGGIGYTDVPCQELCLKAQYDCAAAAEEIGFLWPEAASCDNLPSASENKCDSFGISDLDLIQPTILPDENATDIEYVTEVTDIPGTPSTEIYTTRLAEETEGPLPTDFTEYYTELSNVTEEAYTTESIDDSDVANLTDGMCASLNPRRYDIEDLGSSCLFRGWADVQAQGAANDYCRVVKQGGPKFLSCALAGSSDDHVYTSPNASIDWFDAGHTDTWYMKDEDGDGRDDYCRCVGIPPDTYISCMKAGESGFIGHDDFQIEGAVECEYNKVNPFFGAP